MSRANPQRDADTALQRILADVKADEITVINNAIAKNPAYIQLQSLEAIKAKSKDPASKL